MANDRIYPEIEERREHERDYMITYLKQEVRRCTALQDSQKGDSLLFADLRSDLWTSRLENVLHTHIYAITTTNRAPHENKS